MTILIAEELDISVGKITTFKLNAYLIYDGLYFRI